MVGCTDEDGPWMLVYRALRVSNLRLPCLGCQAPSSFLPNASMPRLHMAQDVALCAERCLTWFGRRTSVSADLRAVRCPLQVRRPARVAPGRARLLAARVARGHQGPHESPSQSCDEHEYLCRTTTHGPHPVHLLVFCAGDADMHEQDLPARCQGGHGTRRPKGCGRHSAPRKAVPPNVVSHPRFWHACAHRQAPPRLVRQGLRPPHPRVTGRLWQARPHPTRPRWPQPLKAASRLPQAVPSWASGLWCPSGSRPLAQALVRLETSGQAQIRHKTRRPLPKTSGSQAFPGGGGRMWPAAARGSHAGIRRRARR